MNIVIPLGLGSIWQDNELRYCLRSIKKHLTGWQKIYIIGEKPYWLQTGENLIHLPAKDKPGARLKDFNIHSKILAYIKAVGEIGNFLFMNDDHFLTKDFEAGKFPYHHKGKLFQTIQNTFSSNRYRVTLQNTHGYLLMKGLKPYNFDTHCPIVYNAKQYIDVMPERFPAFGYAIKTMYCSLTRIEGEFYPDCKLGAIRNIGDFKVAIHGRPYFSIGNAAIGEVLGLALENMYPDKTEFEG